MIYPGMTKTESKIRLLALHECMESGSRYNDALARTLKKDFSELGLDGVEEWYQFNEFKQSFLREYGEYKAKMQAAGLT